ncbi:ABC transporter permease subunit [Streptomyces sp. 3MP-14]|uniref:ABC transporter permease subunit n=1 Tax=Streptomyces mimosae TaxID=2586635 RepID=A0A5N6AR54_9ACTN|nr:MULTISPECIES: sugar ABC transporter permease [Streptomyces]KAB8171094.1 ABC transporter permease subunit [Streptomyces mimosae]KAB8179554.1 ABC transporter permease subunit [Streptomyces sp. 3MP-14]
MTTDHASAAPPVTSGGAAPRHDSGKADGPSSQEQKRTERRSRWYRWDLKYSPYAFISPFFLFFAAFGLFPLLYTGWAAMHQVSMTNPNEMEWVGFENFSRLWDDEFFWNALRNTFTIGLISTVPQLLMALGLAHILNYRMRGSMMFRVAMLTPYATSVAAATLVFAMLYGRDYGMINWALDLVGIDPVSWEAGTWSSQFAVSSIVIWRWTGYNTLIYLAAMQAVPNDLYESASLDGASRWQQFRHVTIPALRPTILFTVVVSTIGATQLFGEAFLLAGSENGGSQSQYQTLGLYMYETGWFNLHLGRAAAIAWTMFLLLIIIGILYWVLTRLVGKSNGEEA